MAAGAGCVCARTTPPEKCKRISTGQSLFKLVVTSPGCITKMKKKRQAGIVRYSSGVHSLKSFRSFTSKISGRE